jgi:hypothetical protein
VIFAVLKVFFFPTVDNVVQDKNQKETLFIKQLTTITPTENLKKEK